MFEENISRFQISLRFDRNHVSCILCTYYRGIGFLKKDLIVYPRLRERCSKYILYSNVERPFFKMVLNLPGGNRGCVIGDISRAMGDC